MFSKFNTLLFNCFTASTNTPIILLYEIHLILSNSFIPTASGIINSTSCAINPRCFLSGSYLKSLYSTPRSNNIYLMHIQ